MIATPPGLRGLVARTTAHLAGRVVVGVDATNSWRRPPSLVAWSAATLDWSSPRTAAEATAWIAAHRPTVVAIDAPLWRPGAGQRRASEVDLSKAGIPCYWTTERSLLHPMIDIWGFENGIAADLRERGIAAVEVYPYATKLRLWNRRFPPKQRPDGLAALQSAIAQTGILAPTDAHGLTHDECDALLAALTGALWLSGDCDELGGPEPPIVIPRRGCAGP